MFNKQIIVPDDFYDYVEKIADGSVRESKLLLPQHIRDELFLGTITEAQLYLMFLGLNYDITKVDLDVNVEGVLTLSRVIPPFKSNNGLSDLGGLDNG